MVQLGVSHSTFAVIIAAFVGGSATLSAGQDGSRSRESIAPTSTSMVASFTVASRGVIADWTAARSVAGVSISAAANEPGSASTPMTKPASANPLIIW